MCGEEECARWEAGEWTLCQRSRCFGRNTAIQKREVKCRYANGTEAMDACSLSQRPISRQECYSERCKGVWRVEPWSEVSCRHLWLVFNFIYLLFIYFFFLISLCCSAMRNAVARELNTAFYSVFGMARADQRVTLVAINSVQQLWKCARLRHALQTVSRVFFVHCITWYQLQIGIFMEVYQIICTNFFFIFRLCSWNYKPLS